MTTGRQFKDYTCTMADGPNCYGFEVLGEDGDGTVSATREAQVTAEADELAAFNDELYKKSKDDSRVAGVKIVEGATLF